jgi:hypothetical protein
MRELVAVTGFNPVRLYDLKLQLEVEELRGGALRQWASTYWPIYSAVLVGLGSLLSFVWTERSDAARTAPGRREGNIWG